MGWFGDVLAHCRTPDRPIRPIGRPGLSVFVGGLDECSQSFERLFHRRHVLAVSSEELNASRQLRSGPIEGLTHERSAVGLGLEPEAPALALPVRPGDQPILLELQHPVLHGVGDAALDAHRERAAERQRSAAGGQAVQCSGAVDLAMAARIGQHGEDAFCGRVDQPLDADAALP